MYAFRRSSSSPKSRKRKSRNNRSKSPQKGERMRSRSRSRSQSRSSKIIISSRSVPSRKLYISKKNLKNIYDNKLTLDYEVCGFIEKHELNSLKVNEQDNISSDTKRKSCQTREYSKVIYHTHPNTSKFYPSVEDIMKIVKAKNKKIMCSIIFTKYGIWEIIRKNFQESIEEKNDEIEELRNILYKIYYANENGRKIKNLKGIYESIELIKEILDIDIYFTLWTNSNYILYFQDFE